MNIGFIVGTGRCGSTLVHEMLARHENVGFISNIEDNLPLLSLKGRYNNGLFRTSLGKFTRKGKIRFAPSEAYRLIGRQVSPIYENSCRDLVAEDVTPWLSSRFQEFFKCRYDVQGKDKFLHKYTGWSRIGFFSEIFPQACFVHVVRDGRAVANSFLQMPWWGGYRGPENWLWGLMAEKYRMEWEESGRSYIVLAGIAWKILMDSYEISSEGLADGRYLWLRYEDFIANPPEELKKILDFIGLPWTQQFSNHVTEQAIYSSRSHAFKRELSSSQITLLEECLSEKLVKYGYVT